MRLGVLFSGGKDSVYACYKAMQHESVACLITIVSENEESYMFHTPNIGKCSVLSKSMGVPHLEWQTKGQEELELEDLKNAIKQAMDAYGIDGIVTGAIESVYQASRVQRICSDLGLWCFNPLWQVDQLEYLQALIDEGFDVMISGVFAYPLGEDWLGRRMDNRMISELRLLKERYKINPSGEGGELETFVLDGPIFNERIEIISSDKDYWNYSGRVNIKDIKLVKK